MSLHVSSRAVLQRVNRKLAPSYEAIRTTRRGSAASRELGRFYRLDTYRNIVTDWNVDLAGVARACGAMHDGEQLRE